MKHKLSTRIALGGIAALLALNIATEIKYNSIDDLFTPTAQAETGKPEYDISNNMLRELLSMEASLDEIKELMCIPDHNNEPIFYKDSFFPWVNLLYFIDLGGNHNYASTLASIEHNGETLFSGKDLVDLLSNKKSLDQALELSEELKQMIDQGYEKDFSFEILLYSGDIDYVKNLEEIKTESGERIFDQYEIKELLKDNIINPKSIETDLEKLREGVTETENILKVLNKEGLISDDYTNLISVFIVHTEIYGTTEYLIQVTDALRSSSPDGELTNEFFSLSDESNSEFLKKISELHNLNPDREEVTSLIKLRDSEGNPLFRLKELVNTEKCRRYIWEEYQETGHVNRLPNLSQPWSPLIKYLEAGGTLENAEKMSEKGFDGIEIFRYLQVGYTNEDFNENRELIVEDTEKPKAVIFDAYGDWNSAWDSENGYKAYVKHIERLKEFFDVTFKIVSNENEVYEMIEENSDAELVVFQGHSDYEGIALRTNRRVYGKEANEEDEITREDTEFSKYLKMLPSNAVIFLHGCSTATGEQHFAEYMAEIAGERRVIASKEGMSARNVTVNLPNPELPHTIEIRITSNDGRDITYDSAIEDQPQ